MTKKELTAKLEIEYSTLFTWQDAEAEGSLENESSRPEKMPRKSTKEEVREVLEVIFKKPDWGVKKLSQYLCRKEILYITSSTIWRIKKKLKEELDMDDIRINQRYEFIEPNDCWSIDFLEFDWQGDTLYLCLIMDDKSRYILDWSITASPTFEFVKELLEQTFERYGKPEVIKSDNGPQFRKKFENQLKEWMIEHHPSPTYCPSYNGKLERKNRDLREIIERFEDDASLEHIFSTIAGSIHEHNHIRPHQSLGGATPYQSYNGFADKVKAKMEAFKKREKRRKGFKVEKQQENQKQDTGVSVPVHKVNDPETIIGNVKSFLEIRL